MGPDEIRERAERLQRVAVEMDSITREVGPKLIRLAHLREEARAITQLLKKVTDGQPAD